MSAAHFQSDDFEMIDEDDTSAEPADPDTSADDDSDNTPAASPDDENDDDEDGDDATSSTDGDESDIPAKRFVPLSKLFASMESIDVGPAAVQNSKPDSEITFPENVALTHLSAPQIAQPRGDVSKFMWATHSNPTHHPLYFEDIAAERCGIGHGHLTTWHSTAHFFGRIPLVPYMLTAQRPDNVVAVNTDCVPGKPFNCQDIQSRPALIEALAVTALVFIVP